MTLNFCEREICPKLKIHNEIVMHSFLVVSDSYSKTTSLFLYFRCEFPYQGSHFLVILRSYVVSLWCNIFMVDS